MDNNVCLEEFDDIKDELILTCPFWDGFDAAGNKVSIKTLIIILTGRKFSLIYGLPVKRKH